MTLRDMIHRLLGLQGPSASTAKQRLQLVLAHDRSDLNPELLEQMRREILEVVSRYLEIDVEGGDVSLATEDRITALVANLPIRRARPSPLPRPGENDSTPPPSERRTDASTSGQGGEAEMDSQDPSPSAEPSGTTPPADD